eukprot:767574-Hanusia_phi.AAC.1
MFLHLPLHKYAKPFGRGRFTRGWGPDGHPTAWGGSTSRRVEGGRGVLERDAYLDAGGGVGASRDSAWPRQGGGR